MPKHLWEVRHPYYCNEGNFYSRDPYCFHKSWGDFAYSMGDSDPELNLLFRWDWVAPHEDGDFDKAIKWEGDENYRDSTLKLFWVMQRKGIFACHEVSVCRADEPAIRLWLQERVKHLLKLWEPLDMVSALEGVTNEPH